MVCCSHQALHNHPVQSQKQHQLLVEKISRFKILSFLLAVGVALGRGVDRVIVQGFMAATNHSERCGNEGGHVVSSQNGMTARSEGKRHEVSLVKGHSLSKSFRRVNVDAGDHLGRNSMKKKLPSSKKTSCASLGNFDVDVNLPPFGPHSSSHGNMGNKLTETLRLFQVICRKLLQGEESMWSKQGYKRKRIDLLADKIIRARGIETGKRLIGSVSGVEVNDQFQYRVELALVGIHRPYQGGIDFMKHDGMRIATSIVLSGSYADDLDNPDILIYSGQGGNVVGKDKRPKEQKLETRNLALKNSISVKNPIKNGGEFPYNYSGAIVETKTLVYECGPACKCPPSCYNRVSQLGIQIQLEIFKTKLRGWGVSSLTAIPSGSFICEYIGELLEAERLKKGKTTNAANHGNVGRFINHSCSPNLYAQNVLYDHEDKRMAHIMLFAAENIPPLKELTYHYNYKVDQIRDSNGEIRMKTCYCGSAECTGRMY
ncbi:hypothetical protein Vadar_006392 [Vaccinium darrowii]|uniref:Uncharacterized protein n=1 Tax=Vaccinium darrowii TaxID=229202 RepID=A0ACB7Z2P7_9ERIC|nr:hypothetical protein Vadar_006392 [Vaccinium darrowii]